MLSELDYYMEIKVKHVNSVLCTCLAAPQVLCVHLARTFDKAINRIAFSRSITKEIVRVSENNRTFPYWGRWVFLMADIPQIPFFAFFSFFFCTLS